MFSVVKRQTYLERCPKTSWRPSSQPLPTTLTVTIATTVTMVSMLIIATSMLLLTMVARSTKSTQHLRVLRILGTCVTQLLRRMDLKLTQHRFDAAFLMSQITNIRYPKLEIELQRFFGFLPSVSCLYSMETQPISRLGVICISGLLGNKTTPHKESKILRFFTSMRTYN